MRRALSVCLASSALAVGGSTIGIGSTPLLCTGTVGAGEDAVVIVVRSDGEGLSLSPAGDSARLHTAEPAPFPTCRFSYKAPDQVVGFCYPILAPAPGTPPPAMPEFAVDGEAPLGDRAVFRFVEPNANVASEWAFVLREGGRALDASLRGAGVNGTATGTLRCNPPFEWVSR